jgi:hypothetical protein
MVSSNQGRVLPHWSSGRSFVSADPERQGEVVGYVRQGPIERAPTSRSAQDRGSPARTDWRRVQPDRDFEGSSSRHGR